MSQRPPTITVDVDEPTGDVNVPIKNAELVLCVPDVIVVCADTSGI
jgi:hypothetical protein